MDERSLEKAMEIVAALVTGEEIGRGAGQNRELYEEWEKGGDAYLIVTKALGSLNLTLYEYGDCLYVTPGEKNRVFGYTNDELKRRLGLRLNRELYLCYFIIYVVMVRFYRDTMGDTMAEYVKVDETVGLVDEGLAGVVRKLQETAFEEWHEESFKGIATLWEDLPILSGEDYAMRAAKNSKAGYVKLVFNFLVSQDLFLEMNGNYYPKDRMRAIMEHYFEENNGRLHELIRMGEREDA